MNHDIAKKCENSIKFPFQTYSNLIEQKTFFWSCACLFVAYNIWKPSLLQSNEYLIDFWLCSELFNDIIAPNGSINLGWESSIQIFGSVPSTVLELWPFDLWRRDRGFQGFSWPGSNRVKSALFLSWLLTVNFRQIYV